MAECSIRRNHRARVLLFCAILGIAASLAAAEKIRRESAAEKIAFRRLTTAILKMDGKQVKFWDVYQAEKRGHLVLVQLGRRYLLLDTKEKEVLEIAPGAIEERPKGNDVVWARSPQSETKIESEEWSLRSIGPAIAVKVRLSAEGRVLELQLPRLLNSGWFY